MESTKMMNLEEQISRMKSMMRFETSVITESKKTYTAKYVAKHIWDLLDHEDNDWGFKEYYDTIQNFGDKWELIDIDPNELEFNEDFDEYTVEDYEDNIDDNITLNPIVIDGDNDIIDGNHRAKASLNKGITIKAYKPI